MVLKTKLNYSGEEKGSGPQYVVIYTIRNNYKNLLSFSVSFLTRNYYFRDQSTKCRVRLLWFLCVLEFFFNTNFKRFVNRLEIRT